MIWMESFCFCCTVRLGVILSAIFSSISKLIELLVFTFYGEKLISEIVQIVETDPELKSNFLLKSFSSFMKQKSDGFIVYMIIDSTFHIVACLFCIYGTYKLNKWFLMPYILTQCFFTIRALLIHIIAMLVIKKSVNLGFLIGLTIIGGFIVLLLGYQWSGAVGMYQIINLVKSSKYKVFYGENPFHPIDLLLSPSDSVENIKVFTTPNYDEVDNLKTLNSMAVVKQKLFNENMNNIATINNGHYINNNDEDLRNFWHINELIGFRKKNFHRQMYNGWINSNSIGYF